MKNRPLSPSTGFVPKAVSVVRSGVLTGFAMKSCPLCKCQVREDRLERHVQNRCPQRPDKPENASDTARRTSGGGHGIAEVFQQLSKSRKPVLPSNIGRRGSARQQISKRALGNASPQSLRDKGSIEVERPSWWNNLDATKDYGYPAREAGRYGSHPSHDGFDDESKP